MASVLQPLTACLKKGALMEQSESHMGNEERREVDEKTKANEAENAGLIWRMSSRLYNIGSGAVGLGLDSVKWAASTTLNVGSGVVSATQTVGSGVVSATQTVGSGVVSATQTVVAKVIPSVVPKPKKE